MEPFPLSSTLYPFQYATGFPRWKSSLSVIERYPETMTLAAIDWTVNPEIFSLGPIHFRWYGLLFATGFFLGFLMTQKVFQRENEPEKLLDSLLFLMIGGTIIGARFGHVFFYNWDYYSQNLGEIIQIQKGGLASHGAAVGLFLAFVIYRKFFSKRSVLWTTDRLAMSVALGGFFIRMGNLMNHEIVGLKADLAWAFKFHFYEEVPVPRHPVQLYEAFSYLAIFGLLFFLYWKTDARKYKGMLTGLFGILVFGVRIVMENFKTSQGGFETNFESNFGVFLSTGQWLSIPLVLFGIGLVAYSLKHKSED
ncbi:prolipoprotein diacylglyceryl transferase [Pontibacter sp. G13]|uniref:prolipoprotein diacylglyceryl transferase n=1 Tax=Pontibacter sp. G13 TaxID=3074898 RepID=UPI00288A326B|nr:prolipoprotein diacylglyceryl transferase [Pontibacter sp. G13]WNJ18218.1 prolipoprotein diacylglyceryl transferase [Pontibacter sp. G13]